MKKNNVFLSQDCEFIHLDSLDEKIIKKIVLFSDKLDLKSIFLIFNKPNSLIQKYQSLVDQYLDKQDLPVKIKCISSSKFLDISSGKIRGILDGSKNSYICGIENYFLRPKCHINQVYAKIAKDKNHTFIISISRLLNELPYKRVMILTRLKIALKLFIKYRTNFILAGFSSDLFSMRSKHEKESFIRALSCSSRKP